MSDFEILYIVLMIISIIVTILIEYINNSMVNYEQFMSQY